MTDKLEAIKGIPPGMIIARELEKRNLSQREFAATIDVNYQTLNSVIFGRRKLTLELADKLDSAFEFEHGFLYLLQAYYDVKEFQRAKVWGTMIEPPNIRKSLFWDTSFDAIDWAYHKKAVIQRVLERGSREEVAEIMRFYNLDEAELSEYHPTNSYRIRTPDSL